VQISGTGSDYVNDGKMIVADPEGITILAWRWPP
jgi:hypothetical protein